MRPTGVVVAALAAALLCPAAAYSAERDGSPRPFRAACKAPKLRQAYALNQTRVAKSFGKAAPGRDVRKTGSCRQLGRSVRTFRRWLNQSSASAMRGDRTPTRHRTSPRNTGGFYAIPSYIVRRESRGNYVAVNTSSGAYGAYQIMPFHWSRGVCSRLGKDPPGQDACAAILWAEGSFHWAATR